ncbi:Protein-tyrosine phosphatase [Ancylostoma caninum]|uniref:Protein-tyrosine phosphatase n=1 Tax=Ancylostoma caninum TaxID=29170 RepID=A0A368G0V3_ANCCA|nr:Protein-tyrosine phosphatase [Ancylostoma caninum]
MSKATAAFRDAELTRAFDQVSEAEPTSVENWSYLMPPANVAMKRQLRRQIRPFVENALRKGPLGLAADFRQMKRKNDLSQMNEFVAQEPNGKNRYNDVGCLDHNRVVLSNGPCSYIHANYVSTPNNPKRFICTQGPLPTTCSEFWHMIVQDEVEVIIMLCDFVEQGTDKCYAYYPTKKGKPLTFPGNISVSCKGRDKFIFPFETKIKIKITSLEVSIEGQSPLSVSHYQWMDWPDKGVPEADLAPLYLLHQFRSIRTGSMVLLENAMEVLEKGETLYEMDRYLTALRTQRSKSVQTEQQYLYVHQVILNLLRAAGWLPRSLEPYLEMFLQQYLRLIK